MSTTVTLTPVAVVAAAGWAASGGGTVAANLADANDATAASSAASTGTLIVSLGDVAIPADAVVKSVKVRFRASQVAGSEQMNVALYLPASGVFLSQTFGTKTVAPPAAVTEYAGPEMAQVPWRYAIGGGTIPESQTSGQRAWTQTDLDALQLKVYGAADGGDFLVRRAVVEVVYNQWSDAGPVTVLDTAVTSRPRVLWAYTDPENDDPYAYHVKVFTSAQYEAAGFDATTSAAVWDTGEVVDDDTFVVNVGVDLVNGVTYKAYVRTMDDPQSGSGAWSPWDSSAAWTQDVQVPAAPEVTVVPETALGRVAVTVQALDSLLNKASGDIDSPVSGLGAWAPDANCTVLHDNTAGQYLGLPGALKLTATANGSMRARQPAGADGADVAAGTVYVGRASFKAAVTVRQVRVLIRWYGAAAELLSTSNGADVADSAATFVEAVVVAAAPANAVYATLVLEVLNSLTGEVHRTDWHALTPAKTDGTAPASWTRGGLLPTQKIRVERSDDAGVTWAAVVGLDAVDVADTTQRGVVYDYTAPTGNPRYRAVSTSTDGSYTLAGPPGASVVAAFPAVEEVVWLKDPADPTRNIHVSLYGDVWEVHHRERVKFFDLLGRDRPVAQSGGHMGAVIPVVFQVFDDASYQALTLLRRSGRTLLLQTDMTGVQWWVRFDGEVTETLHRSIERRTKPYRRLRTNLVEVDPPT